MATGWKQPKSARRPTTGWRRFHDRSLGTDFLDGVDSRHQLISLATDETQIHTDFLNAIRLSPSVFYLWPVAFTRRRRDDFEVSFCFATQRLCVKIPAFEKPTSW